jgi:hypothetical protein
VLGRLLPRPDLVLLLQAPPAEVRRRKPELSEDEIARQLARWRQAAPAGVRQVPLSGPADAILRAARAEVVSVLERRATARLADGWVGIPFGGEPRWLLPRGRVAAPGGLRCYQPITALAGAGWRLARALAGTGAFRMLPRNGAPRPEIRELLAPYLAPGGTFAVSASPSHAERYVAVLLDRAGRETAVAKLALDERGRAKLARERSLIERLRPDLPDPLRAPELVAADDDVLVFRPAPWRPRVRPWVLPQEVAAALGDFHASTGAAHGDFAPWNLLEFAGAWTLIDWEDATLAGRPLDDLFHYLCQSAKHLGRPRADGLHDALAGDRWAGRAFRAYAGAVGLDASDATALFDDYLTRIGW